MEIDFKVSPEELSAIVSLVTVAFKNGAVRDEAAGAMLLSLQKRAREATPAEPVEKKK